MQRWPLLLLAAVAPLATAARAALELGANFNEHLHVARVPVLDATGVRWVRGFVPVGEFVDVTRDDGPEGNRARPRKLRALADDPGIATFRAAAASGRKLAVTLKWDFRRARWRVPAPGSSDENAVFAFAVDLARGVRPDLLLLVNEVFIDTEEADLRPGADGAIPMVRFLQRLAAHVAAAKLTAPDGAPLPVGCGGFTRLDLPAMRQHPAMRALLPWLAETPHLTHVNFHLHHHSIPQLGAALDFIRAQIPARPFVVTEFSLVWSFQAGMADTLGSSDAGRAFAEKFNRSPRQTCGDYLSAVSQQPVTECELHAFLGSRAWFDPLALEKMCRAMEERGVVLATYAYLQASSGLERPGSPIGNAQPPWRLNPVFQERHAYVPDKSRPAVQLGFFQTFIDWQRRSRP